MALALDAAYLIALALASPLLLFRSWKDGKYRDGWKEKVLGRAPRRIGNQPCLWLHAVSVGEVLLLKPILQEFARRHPEWDVVISTTTATGLDLARRVFPDYVTFYAPLDFSWATRRAIARIRPTALGLVELELWPNLIAAAKRSGASVALINGRLSARSFRGYRQLKGPLRSTLHRLDLVAAQTPEYAGRFRHLGIPESRIVITGSVKYDGLESARDNAKTLQLRRELGLKPADVVFVAGSTMDGEEPAVLAAYRRAKAGHPRLRLIVVPRHPERFDRVAAAILDQGERLVRRSRPGVVEGTGRGEPVLLVDSIGELSAVWGLADLAFVGGSLFPGRGGQNMMEPAAYGASVLFGPHTQNFRSTVEQLLERAGAKVVADADDLASALIQDLEDPEAAEARGQAAREFVLAQHGATERTMSALDALLEPPMDDADIDGVPASWDSGRAA